MLELWSRAIAAGVRNELFWEMTFDELHALCEAIGERERAANLRAGLVASAVYNVHRGPGQRALQPTDFIRMPLRDADFLDAEAGATMMDAWAASINQGYSEVH